MSTRSEECTESNGHGSEHSLLQAATFATRLKVMAYSLTDTELKVGDYFLRNPDAAYLSITDVVEDSGLGYGSIMRFCKKMGCAGFQDFKVLLARELGPPGQESTEDQGDHIVRYAEKIRLELAETEKLLNREIVKRAAEVLDGAGRVLVAGIAGSMPAAIAFDYRLSRLGINSSAECEGYTMGIRVASLKPSDVFMAVSFSGATKAVLSAARIAGENGVTVISLTNFVHAPLVDLADIALFSVTDRDPLSCEIFSNVSSSFVLDVVFSELFRIRKGAREAVEATYRAIADRRV